MSGEKSFFWQQNRFVNAPGGKTVLQIGKTTIFARGDSSEYDWEYCLEAFSASMPDSRMEAWVYGREGRIFADVSDIFVTEDLQGYGIGGELTRTFFDGCEKLGVTAVRSLHCNIDSLRTRRSVFGGAALHAVDWADSVGNFGDAFSYDEAIERVLSAETDGFSCIVPFDSDYDIRKAYHLP